MSAAREVLDILLDALLGSHCIHCGERVYPKDRQWHHDWDHADEAA